MPISHLTKVHAAYEYVKDTCATELASAGAGDAILALATQSLRFLETQATYQPLVSAVPGKEYASYKLRGTVARPANTRLWMRDPELLAPLWSAMGEGQIAASDLASMLYTVALAPCLVLELFDRQNKKEPATYFECLIGHIFAKRLGRSPQKKLRLSVDGEQVSLTMDFLFDLGQGHGGVHLPVKMSTRERVVQAWAHQRILDGAFGTGHYRGIMVSFSETKLAKQTLKVTEICVPIQWLAYQKQLARLEAIYYFDLTDRYKEMSRKHPDLIQVREFSDYLTR